MHSLPVVSNVRFTRARELDRQSGLLGWARCELDGVIQIDGIAARRSQTGAYTITFPTRRDGHGRVHPVVRASSGQVRRAIEAQVLAQLEAQGELP